MKIEHLSKQIIFRITAEPKNEALLIGRLQINKQTFTTPVTDHTKKHTFPIFYIKMQINKITQLCAFPLSNFSTYYPQYTQLVYVMIN